MADTLFPQAAQLSASAAGGAIDLKGQREKAAASSQGNLTATGNQASSEKAAMQRQQQEQLARQKLEQLKAQEGQIDVDPEIAMGLAKHSGNPGYLQMIGQKMPTKMLLGMYTSDMRAKSARPQVVEMGTSGGKKIKATITMDEDGNYQATPVGEAYTPPAKSPSKSGGSGGPKPMSDDQKKKEANALLDKISKSKDDSAKKALIENYNKVAEDLKMEPYQEGQIDVLEDKIKSLPGKAVDAIGSLISGNHKEQPDASESVSKKFGF